ncbi:hypothetical protein COU60_00650 [Candidatus Pacearchaeota archaeon CG10_big_fil_rev_8_21_14_0_10_34_76]|nr:MAG: hypothetical protein COU60_00650 [Candidatus Pacearchaeota archaeon CG10_big_fil_rev_8_21_14_0_10_34_76]
MNIGKKRELIARTLGVGKARVRLNKERLDELKDAITRQDVRDLLDAKAIMINDPKGRRTQIKRKTRRRKGSIKKKVNNRKEEYMIITRKLRAYIKELRRKDKLSSEDYIKLRKEIRARDFKSKAQIKERIGGMNKE